jgi:hypothetical protein
MNCGKIRNILICVMTLCIPMVRVHLPLRIQFDSRIFCRNIRHYQEILILTLKKSLDIFSTSPLFLEFFPYKLPKWSPAQSVVLTKQLQRWTENFFILIKRWHFYFIFAPVLVIRKWKPMRTQWHISNPCWANGLSTSCSEAELFEEIQTKVLKVFLLCYSQSPLQLCLEISISSNSRNLLQFPKFRFCTL